MGVALEGDRVLIGGVRINAESSMNHVPIVSAIGSIGSEEAGPVEAFSENAIRCPAAQLSSITQSSGALFMVPRIGRQESTLGVAGLLGNDVDDAVYGICSPNSRSGTADDLDSFDVGQKKILCVPVHPREHWGVDGASID